VGAEELGTADAGPSTRRQTIRDSTHYLSATIVAQGVGLLRSIVLPVLLSPAQLGVWTLN
jgi:O-antigen/teichoic acid export membrane protein